MRILYLSQYFPPEAGATQTRAYEMARNFVRLGHSVTMLTEIPNHPSGLVPPAYRKKIYEHSFLDGIDVRRVWVKASPVKNFPNRMAFYLSYMVNAVLAGLFLAREPYDLLYASSPPLFVGGAALALSALKRIPLFFEVRDLWPASAVALGELTNSRAIRWATLLEEACYRHAKTVVVVTHGIRDHLLERGISEEKLLLIPNGANVELFQFDPACRAQVRERLGLEHKFIAVYAGIHGIAQGLETLVETAHRLEHETSDLAGLVHFLLIGDGPQKAKIIALAQQYQLSNLTFLPEQPREAIPAYLSAADVALVPLKNVDLFRGALPSKIFDAWACQRPVILSVDGEARQILETVQGGLFVPPEQEQALVAAIRFLNSNPDEREQMGERGRVFTVQHYSRQALAEKLIDQISQRLSRLHP